jgi:hypothetical protein
MSGHTGPITVHFHGGFLDNHISHSDEPQTGQVTDFWSAEAIHFVTQGKVGIGMSGVNAEGWEAMNIQRGRGGETIAMEHTYRVTATRVEGETLIIDVVYEFGA